MIKLKLNIEYSLLFLMHIYWRMPTGIKRITIDVEAKARVGVGAEVSEAIALWCKRRRLKICRFHSVLKLLFEFW
jgi:hypothetical protein